jgi:hypothetical protein
VPKIVQTAMDRPNAAQRETPRKRHLVGKGTIRLVRPFFRYSRVRDAYVLRIIGRRHGPVLRLKRPGLRPRPPRPTDPKSADPAVRSRRTQPLDRV